MTSAPGANRARLTSSQWPVAPGVAEQDQLAADRVDGDVHAAVVVVVGRGDATPVDERPGAVEADELRSRRRTVRSAFSSTWIGAASLARFVTGIAPFASTRSSLPSFDEVDPGVAPAGVRSCRTAGAKTDRHVRERRSLRSRWKAAWPWPREFVTKRSGRPSPRVVLGGDAHAGVRVGDARRGALLDEAEAERAARLVHVEPVRVEVVRDVEVGPAVAVHVGEDGAEAVVDVLRARSRPSAPTSRKRECPFASGPSFRKSRSRNAEVVRREPAGASPRSGVHVGVAGDEEVGPPVAVDVARRPRRCASRTCRRRRCRRRACRR